MPNVLTGNLVGKSARTNSEIWIVIGKSLKTDDREDAVRESLYYVRGRVDAVVRRIDLSASPLLDEI